MLSPVCNIFRDSGVGIATVTTHFWYSRLTSLYDTSPHVTFLHDIFIQWRIKSIVNYSYLALMCSHGRADKWQDRSTNLTLTEKLGCSIPIVARYITNKCLIMNSYLSQNQKRVRKEKKKGEKGKKENCLSFFLHRDFSRLCREIWDGSVWEFFQGMSVNTITWTKIFIWVWATNLNKFGTILLKTSN